MKEALLNVHTRYKLELAVEDKSSTREIMKCVIISKNRLWVTNGFILASIYNPNIPKEAVGRLITAEHIKYARKVAKLDKNVYMVFGFGKEGIKFSDGVIMPYKMNGDLKDEKEMCGDVVIKFIASMVDIVQEVSLKSENISLEKIALTPRYLFYLLSALGSTFKERTDEANDFIFKFYSMKQEDGKNYPKAVLVNCLVTEFIDQNWIEEKDNIRRNIGVIMPVRLSIKSDYVRS